MWNGRVDAGMDSMDGIDCMDARNIEGDGAEKVPLPGAPEVMPRR